MVFKLKCNISFTIVNELKFYVSTHAVLQHKINRNNISDGDRLIGSLAYNHGLIGFIPSQTWTLLQPSIHAPNLLGCEIGYIAFLNKVDKHKFYVQVACDKNHIAVEKLQE